MGGGGIAKLFWCPGSETGTLKCPHAGMNRYRKQRCTRPIRVVTGVSNAFPVSERRNKVVYGRFALFRVFLGKIF